jgi:isoaspartyl peptidase/L-asparaginase-like protein (Ntn-hydrolase superfamily)
MIITNTGSKRNDWGQYCYLLVAVALVEASNHLSRGRGSSLSSVGATSLECNVLECDQVYSTVCCVAGVRRQCFLLGQ